MGLRIEQQSLARRQVRALQHTGDAFMQSGKNLVERGSVEALFIFEVVIEKGLIDPGAAGNLVRSRTGNTFMGEFFQSGLEDSGAGLFRLTAGAGLTGFDG